MNKLIYKCIAHVDTCDMVKCQIKYYNIIFDELSISILVGYSSANFLYQFIF